MAYFLEYVDIEPSKMTDVLYESNGVKIWVDGKSLPYIDGMVMDWVKQGLNEGFDFSNPNEKDRCGCGESFRVYYFPTGKSVLAGKSHIRLRSTDFLCANLLLSQLEQQ